MTETYQKQVRELEEYVAAGDIAGMAQVIEQLHEQWDDLPEDTQQEILKLEAIFLSFVDIKVGGAL